MLLFFGMQDKTDGRDPLNPVGLKRAGFSGARNLTVEGVYVRVPSQFNMPKAGVSPFVFDGQMIADRLSGERWQVEVPTIDVSNLGISNILPTLRGAIGAMVFAGCANFDNNAPCEFCTVGGTNGKVPVDPKVIVEELKAIKRIGLSVFSVSLNTGQMPSGKELLAIEACASEIKKWDAGVSVSAEVWPYSLQGDLGSLKGKIDTFQVNMEMANDDARKLLCPAKPDSETYFRTFERLKKEGFDVSSVLQTNYYLEREFLSEVRSVIQRMLDMGVIPELLISRAVRGSRVRDGFSDRETTLEQNIERFKLFLGRMWLIAGEFGGKIKDLTGKSKGGCAKCGMCNVNGDLVS